MQQSDVEIIEFGMVIMRTTEGKSPLFLATYGPEEYIDKFSEEISCSKDYEVFMPKIRLSENVEYLSTVAYHLETELPEDMQRKVMINELLRNEPHMIGIKCDNDADVFHKVCGIISEAHDNAGQ